MRMSDVLASRVYDHDGRCLGKVRDVRLVMDGPVRGALAMLRVDAVIVGGNAIAGRLGYLRGGVRGPALLSAVMRPLERRARTFGARDVADWDVEARRLVLVPDARAEDEPDS
jgi:hypothetical protein